MPKPPLKRYYQLIRKYLSDDLLLPKFKGSKNKYAGHCYVASEAFYHLAGGRDRGFCPVVLRHEGITHWWIKQNKVIWDLTSEQFKAPVPYQQGRACGFLTKNPCKRTQKLLARLKLVLNG